MKRSPKLELPPIAIARRQRALADQVCRAIREAIASGTLTPGSRMPSSRVMARMLGISRNTVLAAYETLSLDGLLAGRVGSGTRVCGQAPAITRLLAATAPKRVRRLRESGFPLQPTELRDPDGHAVYIHK